MGLGHYHFAHTWRLAAPRAAVYAALRDVERYPEWWPQARAQHRIDDHSGELTIRGRIPYDLRVTLTQEVEDPVAGVLRARLSGDMTGYSQWTVTGDASRAEARFEQDVELRAGLVRRVGLLVRPLLVANHAYVMRHGEAGLRRYLAK